jgi:ABC-type bacteriocin/lantibiotic exporter with double-glycine peptidase domain
MKPIALRTQSFKQSKMMCGPASLKIVANYFGIPATEQKLARACGSNKTIGTTGEGMLRGAEFLGLKAQIIDEASFSIIGKWMRRGALVVVDWMSPGQSTPPRVRMAGGHYSVVAGLTFTHIILEDPGLGGRRRIKQAEFMAIWFDFDDLYLAKKSDLILRRIIVIHPPRGK